MAKFYRFTKAEMDEFLGVTPEGKPLEKGGFHRIQIPGTVELVYAKLVHPELSLRIYSTIENGYARDNGSDAIRLGIYWRPSEEDQRRLLSLGLVAKGFPMKVGSDTKVLRVQGWRDNLRKRLDRLTEIMPGECRCGAPTVLRTPKNGANWKPFMGCVWGRSCPATNKS